MCFRDHQVALENLKEEQARLLEENRKEEARLRREDADRMERQMETMQQQHQQQLEAARKASENNNMWRDLGHLAGGVVSAFLPGRLGTLARVTGGLDRVLK